MFIMYMALIDNEADQLRFIEIYNSYRKQMFTVAHRILHDHFEAEDAVQTALLQIAKNIANVPVGMEKLTRAYVLTSVKRAALKMLPDAKKRIEAEDITEVVVSTDENLFERLCASQDYDLLLRAMRQLPQLYREVLLLICVQEMSTKSVAELLGRREGTIRQQVRRGKQLLVEICRKEGMCFDQRRVDAL